MVKLFAGVRVRVFGLRVLLHKGSPGLNVTGLLRVSTYFNNS